MAQKNGVSLKVLVDKEKNKVIFAECDHDFVDILFSFLTIPLGTIIKLSIKKCFPVWMGCLSTLYKSITTVDLQHFWSQGCKSMLLSPRNGAETHCADLKLKIDHDSTESRFFHCTAKECSVSKFKLLSYYANVFCECGNQMCYYVPLLERPSLAAKDGGVFAKLANRYIVSDDLQVMVLCTATSFSLLSESGVTDGSNIEERTFTLGANKVLSLLVCSLVSRTPLTETLLKHKPQPEPNSPSHCQGGSIQPPIKGDIMDPEKDIYVKIFVSKSKNVVCYAEAKKDFVNLIFSFLTIPLGHVMKQAHHYGSVKGSIIHLYKSACELDEQCFNSNEHKEILCSPRVAPGFSYENVLLEIEEASPPKCYYYCEGSSNPRDRLSSHGSLDSCCYKKGPIRTKVLYSKSHDKDGESRGGFLNGLNLFTVTDNLMVRPISPILGLSILNELKVPFNDVEERVVRVGKVEAQRLLLSAYFSGSALTNAFMKPNQINDSV